jgi:hypothetical protein
MRVDLGWMRELLIWYNGCFKSTDMDPRVRAGMLTSTSKCVVTRAFLASPLLDDYQCPFLI